MSELSQPRPSDAIKGGHHPPPSAAVVLGGLEGVKRRLASDRDEVRSAALKEALNYGKEGLKLVVQIVQTQTGLLQWAAYDLLWERASNRTKQNLLKYTPLRSQVGVNYTRLKRLLENGMWQEADEETAALMLKVCGREKAGYLRVEDIKNFPCTDLGTIDTLWVKYSNGRFGFSIQKRIWESIGGSQDADDETYCRFGDSLRDSFASRLGWRVNGHWVGANHLTSIDEASSGHLPNMAFLGDSEEHLGSDFGLGDSIEEIVPTVDDWDTDSLVGSFFVSWVCCLFSRVETCKL